MSNNIRITGLNSGLDTDSMIKALNQSYQLKIDGIKKKQSNVQIKQDSWNSLNSKIYDFYSKTLSNARLKSTFSSNKIESSSDALKINNTSTSLKENHTVNILSKAQQGYVTGAKLENISKYSKVTDLGLDEGTYKFNGKDISINENMTLTDLTSKLKEVGVNANFDFNQKRFFISANESGEANDLKLDEQNSDSRLLNAFGISNEKTVFLGEDGNYFRDKEMTQKIEDKTEISDIRNGKHAVRIAGQDAEILLDGVSFKSNSNNIKINGLDLTIMDSTKETINITSTKDSSKALESIKKLVEDYNSLMKEMSSKYHTERGSYEPLTDDEKYSMSESQLKKWEEHLDSSALHRDSTLYSLMQSVNNSFVEGIEIDGSMKFSSDFGLNKNNYLSSSKEDRYGFTINEDKLKKALEEDEESVVEYFNKLSERMYKNLDREMSKTPSLSSKYKVFNDKAMDDKIDSYDKEIEKWEDKMYKAEDKYYKQFAKMEEAFAKMNSQQSFLSSFFNISI